MSNTGAAIVLVRKGRLQCLPNIGSVSDTPNAMVAVVSVRCHRVLCFTIISFLATIVSSNQNYEKTRPRVTPIYGTCYALLCKTSVIIEKYSSPYSCKVFFFCVRIFLATHKSPTRERGVAWQEITIYIYKKNISWIRDIGKTGSSTTKWLTTYLFVVFKKRFYKEQVSDRVSNLS